MKKINILIVLVVFLFTSSSFADDDLHFHYNMRGPHFTCQSMPLFNFMQCRRLDLNVSDGGIVAGTPASLPKVLEFPVEWIHCPTDAISLPQMAHIELNSSSSTGDGVSALDLRMAAHASVRDYGDGSNSPDIVMTLELGRRSELRPRHDGLWVLQFPKGAELTVTPSLPGRVFQRRDLDDSTTVQVESLRAGQVYQLDFRMTTLLHTRRGAGRAREVNIDLVASAHELSVGGCAGVARVGMSDQTISAEPGRLCVPFIGFRETPLSPTLAASGDRWVVIQIINLLALSEHIEDTTGPLSAVMLEAGDSLKRQLQARQDTHEGSALGRRYFCRGHRLLARVRQALGQRLEAVPSECARGR